MFVGKLANSWGKVGHSATAYGLNRGSENVNDSDLESGGEEEYLDTHEYMGGEVSSEEDETKWKFLGMFKSGSATAGDRIEGLKRSFRK